MNLIVRIRPFGDLLSGESGSRFPVFFRERMRVYFSAVMPLLMSCGLIVSAGIWETKQHDYLPKSNEIHWFALFVETYGIVPVVLIPVALLFVVFLGIRFIIKTNKRNVSNKTNSTR